MASSQAIGAHPPPIDRPPRRIPRSRLQAPEAPAKEPRRVGIRTLLRALPLLLAVIWPGPAGATGWDGGYEGLRFSISWLFVPAGMASIEANPGEDGHARLVMTACSYPALDLFYKVRDRIDADVEVRDGTIIPQRYEYRQREGTHRGHQILRFEPGRVDFRDLEEDEHAVFPVDPGTLDMVSAFFATRSLEPLAVGGAYRLPVFDQKKFYQLEVAVLRREKIDTILGEDTPAVVIQPKLETEGIFKRTGDMYIWLSDDERHLPLRMESYVQIGKVIAELTGFRESADWKDPEYRCPE